MDKECPECGLGPLYQDRHDQEASVAHCDCCGAEVPVKEYLEIMEKSNG